jgi:hypothetical protein
MFFGVFLLSIGSYYEFKETKKKENLILYQFFLILYLVVIFFIFKSSETFNVIILLSQFFLICLFIIDVKFNNKRILKFFSNFFRKINYFFEYTLSSFFEGFFLYSFLIIIFLGIIYLIVKLVKYFWYL